MPRSLSLSRIRRALEKRSSGNVFRELFVNLHSSWTRRLRDARNISPLHTRVPMMQREREREREYDDTSSLLISARWSRMARSGNLHERRQREDRLIHEVDADIKG